MSNELNERLFELYRAICELKEDMAFSLPRYENTPFDIGYVDAASVLIAQVIDGDYEPFVSYREQWPQRRLQRVLASDGR